jgi:hypothetical protein
MNELDHLNSYAWENLLHYATWMLEHEVPYKCDLDPVDIPTKPEPAQDVYK